MKKKVQKMTLEKLAIMIQQGFEETAQKSDVEVVKGNIEAVKEDLKDFKQHTYERFNKIDSDISYLYNSTQFIGEQIEEIKKKLDNIVYRHEYETLRDRIDALEKKIKLSKSS